MCREHTDLEPALRRLAVSGDVVAVLPGIYAAAAAAGDPPARRLP